MAEKGGVCVVLKYIENQASLDSLSEGVASGLHWHRKMEDDGQLTRKNKEDPDVVV